MIQDKSKVFLLNTRTPWDETPRARHQLAYALAERGKVVFVSANSYGRPSLRKVQATANLTVVIPSWPLHHRRRYRMPLANELYQGWLFPRLAREFQTRFVLNFDHTATRLYRHFSNVSYYCNDYHIRNYGSEPVRDYFEESERIVASSSRACISTCGYLQARLARWNSRSIEVRLGAPQRSEAPARTTSGNGTIRVAMVDFVSCKKTSFEVLERLAADSRMRVTVYGPVQPDAAQSLQAIPRIKAGGVLTGRRLANALAECDVGIAPYRRDDDNPGRTPNKLWLYLAAGLPCVTTDIPGIRDWELEEGFLYRAQGPVSFREQVARAYREDSSEKIRRRYDYSQRNTWQDRAEEIVRLLEEAN